MTTVVVRTGAATFTTGAAHNTLAVTKPSGTQTGDLVLIWCAIGLAGFTFAVPGFTAVTGVSGVNGAFQLLYRVTDGTEGASFTVTLSLGSHPFDAGCAALGNVDTSLFDPTPSTSGQLNGSSTTVTVPGVTTVHDGDLLMWFGMVHAAGGATPTTITLPAGFTAPAGVVQASSSGASDLNVGLLFGTAAQATHGATGNQNGSVAVANNNGGLLLAIPSPTAPPASGTFGLAGAFLDPAVYSLANTAAGQAATVTDFQAIVGRTIGVRRSAYGFRVIPKSYSTDAPAPTGGVTHGLFGDNCPPKDYGGGTQAQAFTTWQAATRMTLGVWRYYFTGMPPSSINSALQQAVGDGYEVAMSFKPGLTVPNAANLATIDKFLASCKTFGLVGSVTMYHEPVPEVGSATAYGAVQAYYGPTIRKYYRLNYSGICGQGSGGLLSNYQLYYDTATGDGAVFDTATVDYYASAFAAGIKPDGPSPGGHVAIADKDGLPFGILEMGVSESTAVTGGQTQAQGTAYYQYLTTFFSGRIGAGKPNTYVTHFSGDAGFTNTGWPPYTATDYQCSGSPSLVQALAAAL